VIQRATRPAIYDAGALVAAERGDRRLFAHHAAATTLGRELIVPAPVLVQAWRGGSRQANLGRVLRACTILPTAEATAKAAGVLLGRAGKSDAVDAIVVATTLEFAAVVVTSDPDDLITLADAAGAALAMIVL
jgi:predicted nucleic acid-binding protein